MDTFAKALTHNVSCWEEAHRLPMDDKSIGSDGPGCRKGVSAGQLIIGSYLQVKSFECLCVKGIRADSISQNHPLSGNED